MKRPVLWFLFAYAAGLILSLYLPAKPIYLFLIMTAVALAGLLFYKEALFRQRALFPMLLVSILLLGGIRGSMHQQRVNLLKPFIGQNISLQGVITGAPQVEEDRVIYIVETSAVKAKENIYPIRTKVKVSVYPDTYGSELIVKTGYPTGDLLQITGTIKEPVGPRNPKGFDYKGYLARRDIYSTITVKERNVVWVRKSNSFSLDRTLGYFRDGAAGILERVVGGREGDFLKAILLGQRWLIEPDMEDAFTRTGLAHILAISGLHIGYLVVLLRFLQSVLKLRSRTALLLQAIILILYCLLTGTSPSVTRAVIMALIYLSAGVLGRKTDILNSAATAAFLILLIRPMDLLEVSFQLSFLAVCSIGLLQEPIENALKFFPKRIASPMAVGLSSQIGTLPLTTYYFNLISPVSILANLLVLPVLGVVTAGGFLILPIGAVLPSVAVIPAIPLRFLCRLILVVTDFAAGLPYAYFRVVSPSVFTIIMTFLFLWIISRERPGFVRHPSLVCGALLIVYLAGQVLINLATPRELKLVFLDVGQGDSCFIQTPDKRNILIDGGGQAGVDIGQDVVLPYLLKNGVSSLDLVIMSHNHEDHISGVLPVVDQLKTKAFMEYSPKEVNETYLALKNTIHRKEIPVISASAGESYLIGKETWLHVFYPDSTAAESLYQGNENNHSLVLLLESGDASVLFTGDIERGIEYYLTGRMDKQATILKVPHHGSSTSSTEAFLEVVSPEVAVIQSGANNLFGHPTPKTLERLNNQGITVYRNDNQGAIMLSYRSNRWSVRTMLSTE